MIGAKVGKADAMNGGGATFAHIPLLMSGATVGNADAMNGGDDALAPTP